jgi:hypothetical protein
MWLSYTNSNYCYDEPTQKIMFVMMEINCYTTGALYFFQWQALLHETVIYYIFER